jgi:hypothetical protein
MGNHERGTKEKQVNELLGRQLEADRKEQEKREMLG